jgi:tRNA U34 5-methylaminomethyl-2-thiouridine-forming methyltransferase MnmC
LKEFKAAFSFFDMKRQLVKTKDNSFTLFVPELDEHYHSIHGAMQEAEHIFIQAGLLYKSKDIKKLDILEIGFGTGLNALLTCLNAEKHQLKINYVGLEKYPVAETEWTQMDYASILPSYYQTTNSQTEVCFKKLHTVDWEATSTISNWFALKKQALDFKVFCESEAYDLIYFDAFAPSAQPNLWTIDIFERMHKALKSGGTLVTYCVKGEVRRNMKAAGFDVEKIPGPPGKREMARAFKR